MFSRRTIQTLLDGLSSHLSDADVNELVRRLNTPRARLAATWEIAVCYGLTRVGNISYQVALPSGKKPDVGFSLPHMISFVADITTLSDDGYHDENPVDAFSDDLVSVVRLAGLDPNKFHFQIESKRIGRKVKLLIPRPSQRLEMLRTHLVPFLREIKEGGYDKLSRTFSEPDLGITVSYDRRHRYMSSNYRSYNQARSADQNPLRRRLAIKASQLKGVEALAGVIVCDGGCSLLSGAGRDMDAFSADDTIRKFLRSTSSIDFVYTITARRGHGLRADCSLEGQGWTRDPSAKPLMESIMRSMLANLPPPIFDAKNAAIQAEQKTLDFGSRANFSYGTDGEKIMFVSISARRLLEILAGKHSPSDIEIICGASIEPDISGLPNPFKIALAQGQLIKEIEIEPVGGRDDDQITITFGEPDPAAAAFRGRKA